MRGVVLARPEAHEAATITLPRPHPDGAGSGWTPPVRAPDDDDVVVVDGGIVVVSGPVIVAASSAARARASLRR